MWSFSLAGSMRSSTPAIGRGVGLGDAVAAGVEVAVGLALTATAEREAAGGVIAPPQEAMTIASTKSRRPTMPVYRMSREISASAWAEAFPPSVGRTSGWGTAP